MLFRTIAQFEKVSYEQFFKDFVKTFNLQSTRELKDGTVETVDLDSFIRPFYDSIKLPQRATSGSAGYDFYTPIDLNIVPIIRDSIGATNHDMRSKIWNEIFTSEDCPYNSEQGTSLFNDVNYILKNKGGVTIG